MTMARLEDSTLIMIIGWIMCLGGLALWLTLWR
jgi:hypothetical protein